MNLPKLIFYFLILFIPLTKAIGSTGNFDKGTDQYKLTNSQNSKLTQINKLIEKGETSKALNKLYALIKNAERNRDTTLIVEGYKKLADISRNSGDFSGSTAYFNKIIPFILNDYKNQQVVYFKKGGNFQNDGAIDSALVYYKKALFASSKFTDNVDLKAKLHANISGIYYLKQNFDEAIKHSKIAANYQKILGNVDIEAGILNNLGGIYYLQGKYQEALDAFKKTLALVKGGTDEMKRKTRSLAYINMAYAYSGLKDFEKAFEYQDKYFSLNDSLQQDLKYKEIAEIESKYELATKEKEAQIEKTKRLKAEYLSYGLAFAILILLLVLYILYKIVKLNKKNHKLQINQRQLIHQSKIEKIKSDSQAKILVATLDGKLAERKKIASILHDNISALLSAANLHLYASKKQLKENIPIEIEKTQKIILEASEKIRELSHKLISSVLTKFGLSVALQDLCEKASNSELNLRYDSKNIGRFNVDFEVKIFNIITELVNNIIKHSNASEGSVKIEQKNGQLQIVVVDNGKGFVLEEIQEKNGLGLSQIEARVTVMDGIIKIKSTEEGTRVYISVPIQY